MRACRHNPITGRQPRDHLHSALGHATGFDRHPINPEELLSITSVTARSVKKRLPRPAKYRFTDLNGETKTWTGQGRTPKPIAQALAAGKSLDDFLI